jgi:hypothetical protein
LLLWRAVYSMAKGFLDAVIKAFPKRGTMSDEKIKSDLLSQLLYESQAYKKFEDIEKLVEAGMDLSMLPIQLLYVSLRSTSKEQVAAILPKLSQEQRQALRDIDLWKKDEVDPESIYYWMEVYSKCNDDEVILEYVKSEDFLLAIKNQFTVATFDVEEPEYPEGDNYFLTEDNQLLIEYPEDFQMVRELKEMIRRLYSEQGVENAYAFLFKMVVDSYLIMEEAQYQEKIERLREFGFVDYYEALEFQRALGSLEQINVFIKNKKSVTGSLDSLSANQNLHASVLVPYQHGMHDLRAALAKIKDEKRQQFLHFNFVRLVNARMTLDDAIKGGSLAMARVGNQTRQCLELGFEYTISQSPEERSQRCFEIFDFADLYMIGHSLLELTRKKVKQALSLTPFEKDDFTYFLGMYWNAFLDNSMEEVAKYKFNGSSQAKEVKDLETYSLWNAATETFINSLPFIHTFYKGLENLKSQGLLNDQFYLNYEVDNIDFEAIIISSFINFLNGHFEESSAGKMGITVSELKTFYRSYFTKQGEEYLIKGEEDQVLHQQTSAFVQKFGLGSVPRFDRYLYQVLLEQLNGYEVDGMSEEDFRHVGGPILLNLTHN